MYFAGAVEWCCVHVAGRERRPASERTRGQFMTIVEWATQRIARTVDPQDSLHGTLLDCMEGRSLHIYIATQ